MTQHKPYQPSGSLPDYIYIPANAGLLPSWGKRKDNAMEYVRASHDEPVQHMPRRIYVPEHGRMMLDFYANEHAGGGKSVRATYERADRREESTRAAE